MLIVFNESFYFSKSFLSSMKSMIFTEPSPFISAEDGSVIWMVLSARRNFCSVVMSAVFTEPSELTSPFVTGEFCDEREVTVNVSSELFSASATSSVPR